MNCNTEFWKEISYLVTFLVATAISIQSFRKNSIEEKIKRVAENFQIENDELNIFSRRFVTNARAKRGAISCIISGCILQGREASVEIFKKDQPKTLECLENISQECLEKPIIINFFLFLSILLVFFSQNVFSNWLGNYFYISAYGVCILVFLFFVWPPWAKYTSLLIGFLLILPLLLSPIFKVWSKIPLIPTLILIYFSCSYYGVLKDVLSKPKHNSMNYIYEMMGRSRKLALLVYLTYICILSNVGATLPIYCMKNQEIKELFFKLAPLNIFIYFLITIIFLYSFVRKLEQYLKKVFEYLVFEHFYSKKDCIKNIAKQKNYLNRLQVFFASDIDGLLLRRIQDYYEDKSTR